MEGRHANFTVRFLRSGARARVLVRGKGEHGSLILGRVAVIPRDRNVCDVSTRRPKQLVPDPHR